MVGRMHMRFLVVGLLVVSSVLSGCFGGTDEGSEASADAHEEHGADEDHDEGESDENTTANEHVMADIAVLMDGNATTPDNGTVAATVGTNLTFDGSGSMGSNLSYAWDFGDNATGSNVTELHAYAAVGFYDVTLTVTSGNTSANASLALNISSAGPAPGELAYTQHDEAAGTLTLGNPNAANAAGVDHRDHIVTIAATTPDGFPAEARVARIVLDGSGATNINMVVYWRSPAGTNLAQAGSPTATTPDASVTYEAPMPPGDYVVRVRFSGGVLASYTVTADIDYFAL